jgi:hypothetical protein
MKIKSIFLLNMLFWSATNISQAQNQITNLADVKYHVLIVYNDEYQNSNFDKLSVFPRPKILVDSLARTLKTFYKIDDLKILADKGKSEVYASLSNLNVEWKLNKDFSNVLIFFIGHGYIDNELGNTFYVPDDGKKDDFATLLNHSVIAAETSLLKFKHLAIISIGCHSAGMLIGAKKSYSPKDLSLNYLQTAGDSDAIPNGFRSAFNERSIELASSISNPLDIDDFPSQFLIGVTQSLKLFPISGKGRYYPLPNLMRDAQLIADNARFSAGIQSHYLRIDLPTTIGKFIFVTNK